MKRRRFGPTGFEVPVIGLGTWKMELDDRAEATRAIHKALDLGMTHIDTAEMYDTGEVEEIVGSAIAGRRTEVFLVSKVIPDHASYKGTIHACEKSLKRLNTAWLDGYLLHWPGSPPLEETLHAFETLREQGKIRSYGVSNFNLEELKDAVRISNGRIACNQVLYHLEERGIEHEIVPGCRELGVAVVAYSPFAQGEFPPKDPEKKRCLEEIAKARGGTPRQVALRFLTREPHVFAIPKSSRAAHVAENAGAEKLELISEDLERLDRTFPKGKYRKDVPML